MNQTQSFCYLSQFDLFDALSEGELMKDAPSMHGKKYSKGELIYSPHKQTDLIYVLKEGEVILYHSHDGKQETFDTLGPGTLFGNFSVESRNPSHFAEATRDSNVCVFPIMDFLNIIKNKPDLMMRFIQNMADRLLDYERRFKNNLQTAKETIYEELSRLKEKRKRSFLGKFFGSDGPPLRLTHEQIASLTGLNRVTVTRSIKELKEEGLLHINPSNGVIELKEK
jgi:CRP-like cAMP-binding protein